MVRELIDLAGQTMIERVANQALASGAAEVVVATDDERVVEAVSGSFSGSVSGSVSGKRAICLMTDPEHPSGSDRVMEVARTCGWAPEEVVVNVQGDEPLIPPAVIDQVAGLLDGDVEFDIATLAEPIDVRADVFNPNIVKVVASSAGSAMYFSRARRGSRAS